jgi:hypothetical protein
LRQHSLAIEAYIGWSKHNRQKAYTYKTWTSSLHIDLINLLPTLANRERPASFSINRQSKLDVRRCNIWYTMYVCVHMCVHVYIYLRCIIYIPLHCYTTTIFILLYSCCSSVIQRPSHCYITIVTVLWYMVPIMYVCVRVCVYAPTCLLCCRYFLTLAERYNQTRYLRSCTRLSATHKYLDTFAPCSSSKGKCLVCPCYTAVDVRDRQHK